MGSPLECEWANHLRLNDADVKRIKTNSKLENSLGFLMLLDTVSRRKDCLDLTDKELRSLKNDVLYGKVLPNVAQTSQATSSDGSLQQPCPLSFACIKDPSGRMDQSCSLPRQFSANMKFQDELNKPVSLGNGDPETASIKEARDALWKREYPPSRRENHISHTRFIPKEFLENIPEIPKDFKDSHKIVKTVIASCERFSKVLDGMYNKDSINVPVKAIKWAQTLVNIWQPSQENSSQKSLWQEDDWPDIIAAPLLQDALEPDSLWVELRQKITEEKSFEIQSFGIFRKGELKRRRELAKHLNSSKNFLATFFLGKVLNLKAPQIVPQVQKSGTYSGNIFEKDVFKALQAIKCRYSSWLTIFCGLVVLGFDQHYNEFDFLVVCGPAKAVIYIECKYTLTEEIAKKINEQSTNAFKYLEKHLPLKQGWKFLTLACYEQLNMDIAMICSKCQPFLVKLSTLESTFDNILKENRKIEDESLKTEYEDLIKTYLFYALVNKQTFEGAKVAKHQLEKVNFEGRTILLWNLNQLRVLHEDPDKMIIKSGGFYGTGKTEILKTKITKLATRRRGDLDSNLAFLIARAKEDINPNRLLLTKALEFHFQCYSNVKVAELWPSKDIAELLREMFPETESIENEQRGRNTFHLFIDEASKDNKGQIEKYLKNLPKNLQNYIWIVDTDESLDIPSDQNFKIERGLTLNLRNSEDIQDMIPLIVENSAAFRFYDEPVDTQKIVAEVKKELDAKQILILVDERYVVEIKGELEKEMVDINFYGYSPDVENCSEEKLKEFFGLPQKKTKKKENSEKQRILMVPEALVEGFEAEMVLFQELHHFEKKSTHFRAKTKLKTVSINRISNPKLHERFNVALYKESAEHSLDEKIDGPDIFRIGDYLKLQTERRSADICHFDHQNSKNFTFELAVWKSRGTHIVKQYNVVQEKSPNSKGFSYPLLLWLQTLDGQSTTFCIELRGQLLMKGHPLVSTLNCDIVPITELVLDGQVGKWSIFRNAFIAEIIRSHRLHIKMDLHFDYFRLFSMWSRIMAELERNQYVPMNWKMEPGSYDEFRRRLLLESLNIWGDQCHNFKTIVSILSSYASNPEFPYWGLIKTLLAWWNPNFGPTVINHIITTHVNLSKEKKPSKTTKVDSQDKHVKMLMADSTMNPHSYSFWTNISPEEKDDVLDRLAPLPFDESEESKINTVREDLKCLFRLKNYSSSWLCWSTVLLIWKSEKYRVWREVLQRNFPQCIEVSWFLKLAHLEEHYGQMKKDFAKTRGFDTIYLKPEDGPDQETPKSPMSEEELNESSLARDILVFIATSHGNFH